MIPQFILCKKVSVKQLLVGIYGCDRSVERKLAEIKSAFQ